MMEVFEREDGLAIWLPHSGAIPPMPTEIAVVRFESGKLVPAGDLVLEASIGELEMRGKEPEDLFATAVYYPPLDAEMEPLEVTFTARLGDEKTEALLQIDQVVAGRVEVSVVPERFVKGVDEEATITVRCFDAEGRPLEGTRPVLTVNVGSLDELEEIGNPGEWATRYLPSEARYPEVAVFAALLPWPSRGGPAFSVAHAVLPLAAAIDLPGEVRPRVAVTVKIAGEEFGPVISDGRGRFDVPVVVPPGHGAGRGVSVDSFGNRRETEIDLRLPQTNRVTAAVHPELLLADGESRARIIAFIVDEHGAPLAGKEPSAKAMLGTVGRLIDHGEGVYVGWYEPPSRLDDGTVVDGITVGLPGDSRSSARMELSLVSGPPARVLHSVSPPTVAAPSEEPATVELRLLDARGSPARDAIVELQARRGVFGDDGGLEAMQSIAGSGESVLAYNPPVDATGWGDAVDLWASLTPGEAPHRLIFDEGSGEMMVVDMTSRPVPGVAVRLDGERTYADERGRVGVPPKGARAVEAVLPGRLVPDWLLILEDALGRRHGFPSRRLSLESSFSIPLKEPVPVDVEAWIVRGENDERILRWRVVGGEGDRRVLVQAGNEPIRKRAGSTGEIVLDAMPAVPLMVIDVESGVSAAILE